MKVKLDDYEFRMLINYLYQQRCDYDAQTNRTIDDLLIQIVRKAKHKKLRCRQKYRFESHKARLICICFIEWRNQQLQAQKQGAAETISELIILFTH